MSGAADSGILLKSTLNARPRALMEKVEDQLSDDLKAADRDAGCEVGGIAAHWRKCVFLSPTIRLPKAASFKSC